MDLNLPVMCSPPDWGGHELVDGGKEAALGQKGRLESGTSLGLETLHVVSSNQRHGALSVLMDSG